MESAVHLTFSDHIDNQWLEVTTVSSKRPKKSKQIPLMEININYKWVILVAGKPGIIQFPGIVKASGYSRIFDWESVLGFQLVGSSLETSDVTRTSSITRITRY